MQTLTGQFSEIEKAIPSYLVTAPVISKATIGWHLHHIMIVANSVTDALESSDPNNYSPRFSIKKYAILWTKKIPRGRATAPKATLPPEVLSEAELLYFFKTCKEKIQTISSLPNDKYFPHPFFGDLNLKQSIPFIQTHTEHHLKIVRDILRATK